MQTKSQKVKNKVTPKLSALLIALTTALLVVACGGGGSAVGSDSANSTNSATNATNTTGTGTGAGIVNKDDDDCKTTTTTTTTTVAATSKKAEIDDDDKNEVDDDDDDDKNCTTTPSTPPTVAELAAGKLGKALWTTNCFSCHGADTHEVRTAARILNAIAENKGGMGKLKGVISETDAANIAIYAARPSVF